jgi:hypothetical protein
MAEEKNMRRVFWFLIFPALLTSLPARAFLPKQYSAAPIEARVVDKETGKPLAGVVVVAHWALESVSAIIPHQVNPAGSLMILEAVTDQDGWFRFPAWGPKWHWGSGELGDKDPELILFKSGYEYWVASNSRYSRPAKYSDVGKPAGTESKPTGSNRISFWNGETILLEKFKNGIETYARNLSSLNISVSFARDQCNWESLPKMIVAIHNEVRTLEQQKVKYHLSSPMDYLVDNEKKIMEEGCRSPITYFREKMQ